MSADMVLVDRSDRREHGFVATVTINNAAKANSLTEELMEAFVEKVETLSREPDLRAIVVTGAGERSFVAGANLERMSTVDAVGARRFITLVHKMCNCLRAAPVPAIAKVNGACFGAGLELAAACDIRIASDNAVFGMPEVNVGLPSVVEAVLLPQLIGWGKTKLLVYTAKTIDARTAEEWGLLENLVAPGELDEAVAEVVDAIVHAGPNAMRLQKELIRDWERQSITDAVQAGIESLVSAYDTDEPARMASAVLASLKKPKK